jgi:hypothetical protein
MVPPIAPSARLGRALPADLEDIIQACLAKERSDRPASAAALRAALLACTDDATYDAAAASLWSRDRRTALADMARSDGISGSAPTMAVDLRGRHGASGIIAGPPGV